MEAILKQLIPQQTAASKSATHIITQYAIGNAHLLFDFPFLIITCCAAILLVLEYSFFLQHSSMYLEDALKSAVKEYTKSRAQGTVETAISATIPSPKPQKSDKDNFCKNITNITLNHLMCKGHCF